MTAAATNLRAARGSDRPPATSSSETADTAASPICVGTLAPSSAPTLLRRPKLGRALSRGNARWRGTASDAVLVTKRQSFSQIGLKSASNF